MWILAGLGVIALLAYFFVVMGTSDGDASSDYEITDEVGDGEGE